MSNNSQRNGGTGQDEEAGGPWGKKALCIVTGASKGIGRGIAASFSKRLAPGSQVVITARSAKELESLGREISAESDGAIAVGIEVYDMSEAKTKELREMVKKYTDKEKFEVYLLVHNVGSEGSGALTADMDDIQEWQRYMTLNLYSMVSLTCALLKEVPHAGSGEGARRPRVTLVNITSLAAVQPIKGLGYYCCGKASREMYLRCLVEENPHLDILNYSPGPVGTEMVDRVIENLQDRGTSRIFEQMREGDKLVKVQDTVDKLVRLLELDLYKSGGRIDYFNC